MKINLEDELAATVMSAVIRCVAQYDSEAFEQFIFLVKREHNYYQDKRK